MTATQMRPPAGPHIVIHPTAQIEDGVEIGDGTRIWAQVQIRAGARIGRECSFGRNSFVDLDVVVGDCVKVQNNASLFEGVVLEDGVFVGPHVVFTNDRIPRAITPDGRLKTSADWTVSRTRVLHGASVGAGAVVIAGLEIGRWSMIGSGTIVTRDVPEHALVVGNPGRLIGYVSAGGQRCDSLADARAASRRETEGAT